MLRPSMVKGYLSGTSLVGRQRILSAADGTEDVMITPERRHRSYPHVGDPGIGRQRDQPRNQTNKGTCHMLNLGYSCHDVHTTKDLTLGTFPSSRTGRGNGQAARPMVKSGEVLSVIISLLLRAETEHPS